MNSTEDYVQTISALHQEYKKHANEILSLQDEIQKLNRERAAYAEQLRIHAPTMELANVRKGQKYDDQNPTDNNPSQPTTIDVTGYATLASTNIEGMSPSELEDYVLELRIAVESASKNFEHANKNRMKEELYVNTKVNSILKSFETGL